MFHVEHLPCRHACQRNFRVTDRGKNLLSLLLLQQVKKPAQVLSVQLGRQIVHKQHRTLAQPDIELIHLGKPERTGKTFLLPARKALLRRQPFHLQLNIGPMRSITCISDLSIPGEMPCERFGQRLVFRPASTIAGVEQHVRKRVTCVLLKRFRQRLEVTLPEPGK